MPIIKKHWPILTLVIISSILCLLNYTPGTWLSGWDTLHPEFNFGLAFQRTIFGVFRVEQGLGAVAGHSHMADLPRIILLYISHFVLPVDFLRYFYVFLNIIFGTLGMYFFLKLLLKEKTASFLGALFYLLNIGSVQIFNVPFEMFTTLFMTLPFLFYFATRFLLEEDNRTKNLLFFALVSLLNSPSAYAATLWYVFFLCFFTYFLSLSLINLKHDKTMLKNFCLLIIVMLGLNLFWLIPNIYFILNHGLEVAHANINLLFSDQAFYKNKEFGNLQSLLLLKIFYFDWSIFNGTKFVDLMSPYINNFNDVKILLLSYLFGLSFVLGLFYAAFKQRLKSLPFFLVLLICLIFLVNDNFPVSLVYGFLENHIPFFKEAFRFPDDKILNTYVFLVSVFFGFACLFVIEKLKKVKLKAIFALIVSVLIIYCSLPSFFGNYINSYMRVRIPASYFQLFNYLNTQPQTARVADCRLSRPGAGSITTGVIKARGSCISA